MLNKLTKVLFIDLINQLVGNFLDFFKKIKKEILTSVFFNINLYICTVILCDLLKLSTSLSKQ